jgi:hypothetical protein
VYDTASDIWQTVAGMPTKRSMPSVVAGPDGLIYVIGGYHPTAALRFVVEAYNPSSGAWETRAPRPDPAEASSDTFSAELIQGIIYVVRGSNSRRAPPSLEAYDPASDSWASKGPLPTSSVPLMTTVVDGSLYVIDGIRRVFVYDVDTDSWSAKASLPTGAGILVDVCPLDGVIYAFTTASDYTTSRLFRYDPAVDGWTTLAAVPSSALWTESVIAVDD